jgi:hypothetical protein
MDLLETDIGSSESRVRRCASPNSVSLQSSPQHLWFGEIRVGNPPKPYTGKRPRSLRMYISWDSRFQCNLTRATVTFCFRDPTARRTVPGMPSTMHPPALPPMISIKTSIPHTTVFILLWASNSQIRSPSLDSLYVVSFTHYIFLSNLLFYRRGIRRLAPLHSTVTASTRQISLPTESWAWDWPISLQWTQFPSSRTL